MSWLSEDSAEMSGALKERLNLAGSEDAAVGAAAAAEARRVAAMVENFIVLVCLCWLRWWWMVVQTVGLGRDGRF